MNIVIHPLTPKLTLEAKDKMERFVMIIYRTAVPLSVGCSGFLCNKREHSAGEAYCIKD